MATPSSIKLSAEGGCGWRRVWPRQTTCFEVWGQLVTSMEVCKPVTPIPTYVACRCVQLSSPPPLPSLVWCSHYFISCHKTPSPDCYPILCSPADYLVWNSILEQCCSIYIVMQCPVYVHMIHMLQWACSTFVALYYSGLPLIWPPLGPVKVSWLEGWPQGSGVYVGICTWKLLNTGMASFGGGGIGVHCLNAFGCLLLSCSTKLCSWCQKTSVTVL